MNPPVTSGSLGYGARRRQRREAPKARAPLDGTWKLTTADLWALCAAAPSRQHMQRPYPREDLRENLARLYEALWRHAIKARSARIDTTWTQLAVAMGYPREQAGHMEGAVRRWADLLAETGIIQRVGVKDLDGAWQRLDVILLPPAGVAQSVEATRLWRPVTRRRESRTQRHKRRQQPYRRSAGRGVTVPRWLPGKPGSSMPGSALENARYLLTPSCVAEGRGRSPLPSATLSRETNARARPPAPSEGGVDALSRCCPPEARAALAELRSTLAGEEGRAARLAALRAGAGGVPIVVVALAGWEAARDDGAPPALSRRWADRLGRAAAQLDRCHGAGAAAAVLLDRLDDLSPTGYDLAARPLAQVGTLTYYAAELRSQARAAVRYDRYARGRRETPAPRPWKPRGRA